MLFGSVYTIFVADKTVAGRCSDHLLWSLRPFVLELSMVFGFQRCVRWAGACCFSHSFFWIPLSLSLSLWAMAWKMFHSQKTTTIDSKLRSFFKSVESTIWMTMKVGSALGQHYVFLISSRTRILFSRFLFFRCYGANPKTGVYFSFIPEVLGKKNSLLFVS